MSTNLVSHFASAGLELRLADSSFAVARSGRGADVFQLDIRRARAHDVRSEHFLAWVGSGNLAAVQGADRREHQLVLVVREGATEFEEGLPRWMLSGVDHPPGSVPWKQAIAEKARVRPDLVVARTGGAAIVRTTTGAARHMLVGRDERQLFMCQLPEACTTVRQAHEALRSPAARSRSRSALERPVRQGEWFFVVPSSSELDDLDKRIRKNSLWVRRRVSINSVIPRTGKPHVADELVVVAEDAGLRVYVRGAVRHVDHKTIHLHTWRRVHRNLEVDQARSPLGGTWMD
jgi:hypothetical protein